MEKFIALIKGAGEMASGIAHRLFNSGFAVVMTEIEFPSVIRRGVSFAQAVFTKEMTVEGVTARLTDSESVYDVLQKSEIAVLVDPLARIRESLKPQILIDAILAKKNLFTQIQDAPLVIGVGPGFDAGKDVHFCIETMRGHNLGRIIQKGYAFADTKIPGDINGYTSERVIRAESDGFFNTQKKIGDIVEKSSIIGYTGIAPAYAGISGVLRGLIQPGYFCSKDLKIGDIDPRGVQEYCWQISDKARTISGSVLESILRFYPLQKTR
ncbi:MAG: EF2563 family selenium-dependent molybdenum hydroxylase system protein [Candidatus Brocadiae bacterium]|nr:EF2563 family selenium-dependent molybdenum hydroxylase system protein [Candidatus Brocadiia bacterium]